MDTLLLSDGSSWDGKMELLSPLGDNAFLIDGTATFINNTNYFIEDSILNEPWDTKTSNIPSPPIIHNFFITDNDLIFPFSNAIQREFPTDIKISDNTDLPKNIFTQLTPPQSPPRTSPSVQDSHQYFNCNDVSSYIQADSSTCSNLSNVSKESEQFTENIWNGNNHNNPSETLSSFSQMVDEIVNTRAKELNDYSEPISLLFPPTSSLLIDNNTNLSNSASTTSSISSSPVHSIENGQSDSDSFSTISTKKSTRVYERRTEDRKVRKKEQNKNAATRYRLKKKQEMEHVLSEEQLLSNRNAELKKKLADRKREAKYLKALICEFYKNKK